MSDLFINLLNFDIYWCITKAMDDGNLPAGLWIEAKLRELDQKAIPYYVVQKGAYFSGTIVLKINSFTGNCKLLGQIRDENGHLKWMPALMSELVAESEADLYIQRSMNRDPDLWVIEIESRDLNNPFEGKE